MPELDDADVLARFIVPSLERMALPGRTAALTYLQRHWSRLRDNAPLRAALESARFVDANGGGGGGGGGGGAGLYPSLKSPVGSFVQPHRRTYAR